MSKTLVLAEKPSVARELARVLGCNQAREGCLAGNQYIVTWALGHLVTLADPEHYGDQYKKWDLATLPMLPKKMDLVVIKQTSKQYRAVQNLLHSPEVSRLIIATDAGREGELVARWLIEKAGFHKPLLRLWISSQTDRAIREGFQNLRPGKDFESLYQSAVCRAQADWLVGLNVTRALTCKYNAQLSAGRVQTPTLAMVVDREKEIQAFVPQTYDMIRAQFPGFTALWKDQKTGQARLFEPARAEEILRKVTGQKGLLTKVEKSLKKEPSPLLYDLTELQRDANRYYNFAAKQTLNVMQSLYENHKVLTYPRTDSRYLTGDIVPTLPERLKAIASSEFAPFIKSILQKPVTSNKHFVDDSKVSDHHAIIPTEQYANTAKFSPEERKIYDLVVKRFLAVLSPAFEYQQVNIQIDVKGELFTAKGKTVLKAGWKALYQGRDSVETDGQEPDQEQEQSLPDLKEKGVELLMESAKRIQGKTSPPPRYTEATLLSAMEHPGKFIESGSLRAVVDSTGGIGTPATRADIIEKLFAVNYIERKGREIIPLSKGFQLIDLVPADLKSPELTAKWEQRLSSISKGKENSKAFLQEMRQYASQLVGSVIAASGSYRHDNMTRTRCPLCGKYLLEMNGKKGKMLVCQDRECTYRQNLSHTSNARCPECKKKLEVFGEGDKKIYACKCGFREKYQRFNERLAENRKDVSKQDVQKFLKDQQKQEPSLSAFAVAWEKMQQEQLEK